MFDHLLDVAFIDLINPTTGPGALAYAIVILSVVSLSCWTIRAWSARLFQSEKLVFDPTTGRFVGQLLQLVIVLLAATVYSHLVPALHKLGNALLASASVLSLVLGIAAQATLGNLVAGLAILIYRPFALGDTLLFTPPGGARETARVEEFSLGHTRLLTEDGRWIIIPNSVMFSSVLIRVPKGFTPAVAAPPAPAPTLAPAKPTRRRAAEA